MRWWRLVEAGGGAELGTGNGVYIEFGRAVGCMRIAVHLDIDKVYPHLFFLILT
jgi:hypothetical protein